MIPFRFFFVFLFFTFAVFAEAPYPKVMVSFEEYCKKHPEDLIYTKEIPPYNFEENPISKHYPSPWLPGSVLMIPEGKVVGKNGAVIGQDNLLLRNSFFEWEKTKIRKCLGVSKLPDGEYYDGVVADLSWFYSDNYYHWMINVLPRIGLLEESGISPDLYHVDAEKSFQKETLALLGIENKVLPCKKGELIQARSLVLPSVVSFPYNKSGRMRFLLCAPLSSLQFLREKFLNEKPFETGKRIFISRKGASYRRLLNEDEVVALLEPYGFISVQLETLSVKEQAQLFASAEIVVGPHGAGFTNLVFCEPGTKVIEISSDQNRFVFCFWAISQQLGLDHAYVTCNHNLKLFGDARTADLKVDILELEKALQVLDECAQNKEDVTGEQESAA